MQFKNESFFFFFFFFTKKKKLNKNLRWVYSYPGLIILRITTFVSREATRLSESVILF